MSETKATYMGETPENTEMFIRDEKPVSHYSQIPNIVDDMGLSPYAYRLYGHLRRVAGETGKCWQSTATLAEKCGMSAGKVSDAKQELENVYPPLIRVTSRAKDDGRVYHEITITDIWEINRDFYTKEQPVHVVKGEARSRGETYRSRGESKNNPVVQEEPTTGANAPAAPMPLEWKIAHNEEVTQLDIPNQTFDVARARDAADLIEMQCPGGGPLALAFMVARKIIFPESKIKGQRKAARELLSQGVRPEHVQQAVQELTAKSMTVVDLFSVTRTAVSIAHPPESQGYNPQGLAVGI